MVSYNLDFIKFEEQIANLYIMQAEDGRFLSSALYADYLPLTQNMIAKADLFNIYSDKPYLLILQLIDNEKKSQLLSANRLTVLGDQLEFKKSSNIGKTSITFNFVFPVAEAKDYCISLLLIEEHTQTLLSHKELYISATIG